MTNSDLTISGVVVWFNPTAEAVENVETYIKQIDRLYVVDNSVGDNSILADKINVSEGGQVIYLANNANLGIAAALNVGAKKALEDGYRLLLTVDQDTKLSSDFVSILLQTVDYYPIHKIGIVAPRYIDTPKMSISKFDKVLFTMTSGNLLNLDAFKAVGQFREDLFIDHVDHEFCLRLDRGDYWIIQNNQLKIDHRPGLILRFRIMGREILISSHSPVRLYYFCRNGFFVSQWYNSEFPQYRKLFTQLMIKEIIKIVFERDKWLRLQMIVKGYRHFKKGKLGPIA